MQKAAAKDARFGGHFTQIVTFPEEFYAQCSVAESCPCNQKSSYCVVRRRGPRGVVAKTILPLYGSLLATFSRHELLKGVPAATVGFPGAKQPPMRPEASLNTP